MGEVIGDLFALGVVPRTIANAISGVDRVRALRAQVGVEGLRATRRGGERLAELVGAGQSAKICSMAGACAGNEKAHGLRWRLRGLLCKRQERSRHRYRHRANNKLNLVHSRL